MITTTKIYSIELLRFISSLMVVIWHYQHFFFPFNTNSSLAFFDIDNYFISLIENTKLGFHGVYIFFCISGIVFSITYLNKKKITFKKFMAKRFARLYPLHFLTLITVLVVQNINLNYSNNYEIYFLNDIKHFLLNIFLISGWGFEDGHSFNAPIWSVSVEILVYIIFFIFMTQLNIYKYILPLGILIICLVVRKIYFENYILHALILFFSGVILSRLYLDKKKSILLILSILFLPLSFFGTYKIFLMCIGLCSMFLFIESAFNLSKKIKLIFLNLGNLTYASYLIHIPLQLLIILIFNISNINLIIFREPLVFFLFIVKFFFFSYYIFLYFEKPINIYIKKILTA